jgi:hypothetical protein
LGGSGARQGRPPRHVRVPGNAYLTREEVEELYGVGGTRALKQAFSWLYGTPTASGNSTWLRKALMGS